jgi:hypothetical protein
MCSIQLFGLSVTWATGPVSVRLLVRWEIALVVRLQPLDFLSSALHELVNEASIVTPKPAKLAPHLAQLVPECLLVCRHARDDQQLNDGHEHKNDDYGAVHLLVCSM